MNSESERTGGYSPVRRRLIALAGAGGLAGLASAFWPRTDGPATGAGKLVSPKGEAPETVAGNLQQPEASAAPTTVVASSSVAAERERMAGHRGEVFTVNNGSKLVLDRVGELVQMTGDGRRFEGYSLLFKGESGALPADGVFRLSHAALGELELYLGSVCGPATPVRYEAVISRAA